MWNLTDQIPWRAALVIGLLCVLGDSRCTSTVGAGQIRAEKTVAKVDELKGKIQSSNLPAETKASWIDILGSIAKDAKELGKDVDHNKVIADKNQVAADKWFWLVWVVRIAAVVAFLWGLLKIGQKIPFIRNWLPSW